MRADTRLQPPAQRPIHPRSPVVPTGRGPSRFGGLLLLAAFCWVTGCGPLQKPERDDDTPKGPSDPITLRQEFEALVVSAQAGDEAAVLEKLEAHLMTREMIVGFFGPEVGARAWKGYSDVIAAKLRAEAPKRIIEQVRDRGLTEVVVEQVGPAYPQNTTPGDQRVLDAMLQKQPMYTVRLQKPGETLGLRLNGFVFHEGRWRAFLKSYDHLEPVADAAPPEGPPVDAAPAQPSADGGVPSAADAAQ